MESPRGTMDGSNKEGCRLCENPDTDQMVQCDTCDGWFHFKCVNVSQEVEQRDWNCDRCSAPPKQNAEEIKLTEDENPHQVETTAEIHQTNTEKDVGKVCMKSIRVSRASKCGSSKTRRHMQLELMRLEEEKKENMAYLKKKYEIMRTHDDSDETDTDGDDDFTTQRIQRATQWVATSKNAKNPRGNATNYAVKGGDEITVIRDCEVGNEGKSGESGKHFLNGGERGNNVNIHSYDTSELPRFAPELSTRATPSVAVRSRLSAEQVNARHVVPKELPIFNGNPEEWPLFVSSFENSTRVCGFSNDENLLRLQRAIRGKALEYVSNQLMIPALVPEILSTLRMVFGRPEHIINNLLVKMRASQCVNPNRLDSLVNFALEVKNMTATMVAANLHSHLSNPMLLQELVEKLPAQTRINWAMFARTIPNPSLTEFSNWLFDLSQAASSVISFPHTNAGRQETDKRKAQRLGFHEEKDNKANTNRRVQNTNKCCACDGTHAINGCDRFKKMSYNEKWNLVHNKRLCRSCLKAHDLKFCPDRKECGIEQCTAKHHELLHKPDTTNNVSNAANVVAVHHMQTSGILYRIVPITIHGATSSVDVYAFLDDGSGPTLIEKGLLDQLQVQGIKSSLSLRWTDGSVRTESDSQTINLKVSPRGKDKRFSLNNVRSVRTLDLPSQTLVLPELVNQFKHLRGLPVESYQNVKPRVIIGISNKHVAMPLKFREGRPNEPAATKTRLGWTVYGMMAPSVADPGVPLDIHLQLHVYEWDKDIALQKLVLESMSIENALSKGSYQERVNPNQLEKLEKSVKRVGSHFVAKLLWKSNDTSLPDNYDMAINRLKCFEKQINKNPTQRSQVNKYIEDMKAKGYIRKLSSSETTIESPRKWYLPIFAVTNENKPHKIRLVWDAAAEYRGISLNGCLDKGPDLMTSLIEVLFNFRIGKIGICGDIREMFHRVKIDVEDVQSQRFMWRNGDPNVPPDTYVLQVMSFGANCSPSIALYVKNRNAKDHEHEYPRAAKSIIERHYVDDMLDSVNSVQDAVQLAKDVREIHKRGNFHIRNWLSNSREVIGALGEGGIAENFCQAGKTVEHVVEAEKVLGMWWRTSNDTFTYNLKYTKASKEILSGNKLPTKRELLRLLMSFFDPLGLLSNFTVYIKILMQKVWRSGIAWDDAIPDELEDDWRKWSSCLNNVQNVQVPRCYFASANSDTSKVELHVFVDASENAYAAVAYFRILSGKDIEVSLVCSKTKVAPLRPVSIPRMELLAAVMGARLGNAIVKGHDLLIESTHYWSDARTVLTWIRADPRNYQQFVMYRVGEIQETTNGENWHYVPTKLNVADLATKWRRVPDLSENCAWFTGPNFLRLPSNQWHTTQPELKQESDDVELRGNRNIPQVAVQLFEGAAIDCHRFSKWERLVRTMAYVKRFVTRVKMKTRTHNVANHNCDINANSNANLTADELHWSEQYLYRIAQAQAYSDEIHALQRNPPMELRKKSPLKKLSPFVDENMILRLRGRLEKSLTISQAAKNPIILPRCHQITKLLVEWYHRRYRHANHETVINEVFQKYHIPGLRSLLRTIRYNCQRCKIREVTPNPPEMAPLPEARLSAYTRPFSFVGVDFFGPFLITLGRRTEKRYGVVFTCLTCRAIHLEVAHSLSMNSCVMAIQNFISRRGVPVEFFSDNGTNLRAAEKELRVAHQELDFEFLQSTFTTPNSKWTFIPPASPHMGGAWERMVRSIKTVLYQTITPDTKINDEKLHNLLLEVESIVNSRPLTYLSLETAEQEALTPNHFLLGSTSGSRLPGKFEETDQYTRASWRHSQFLANKFWKRWVDEVQPTLTRRTTWFKRAKPIQQGDVVIIVDSNLPRHCWPKGIVTSTIMANDGQVRSATVQTTHGVYRRPATKIAVLDVQHRTLTNPEEELQVSPSAMGCDTGGENVGNPP